MATSTAKLKVGLVGCGGISRVHFNGWDRLYPECEVTAICDILPAALERRGGEFEIPREQWYLDHRDMLRNADIDAVDVCVPNGVHAEIAINALKAGKHVICEKPLAPTPAEIRRMIAARDKAGKILMTAQHQRFERSSQNLKAYLDTGALGEVYYCRAHFLRRRFLPVRPSFITKGESGGGPCIDIGVHILDLALHFMGFPEPVSVSGITPCKLGKRKDIRGWWGEWDRERMSVEDFAAGFVRFADGSALSLECSWLLNIREREYQRIVLCGTEAGAEWPALTVHGETAGCLTDSQLAFPDDRADGHHTELLAFARAILKGEPSPVPSEDSLKVLRILDGLYRSFEMGKEVKV
ncbi:MAG: Gfo/Idh/MocA family oxidoreductase [Lentisphaeria bacterium]|nr:Gfo/Idh/MocA family oxidoreductase [Lentisphaeria bacterium]